MNYLYSTCRLDSTRTRNRSSHTMDLPWFARSEMMHYILVFEVNAKLHGRLWAHSISGCFIYSLKMDA